MAVTPEGNEGRPVLFLRRRSIGYRNTCEGFYGAGTADASHTAPAEHFPSDGTPRKRNETCPTYVDATFQQPVVEVIRDHRLCRLNVHGLTQYEYWLNR
jgi:hypothetical protein